MLSISQFFWQKTLLFLVLVRLSPGKLPFWYIKAWYPNCEGVNRLGNNLICERDWLKRQTNKYTFPQKLLVFLPLRSKIFNGLMCLATGIENLSRKNIEIADFILQWWDTRTDNIMDSIKATNQSRSKDSSNIHTIWSHTCSKYHSLCPLTREPGNKFEEMDCNQVSIMDLLPWAVMVTPDFCYPPAIEKRH